ncbi:FadR/GntR family transcriptional regulator [Rhodococcus koreensis]
MTIDGDPYIKLRRETVFSPLGGGGRAESIGLRIASAVHLGLLADGEQLPSETELAAQLNVSTVTLREALVHLRAQGLIETRRGRNGGSFIRSNPAISVPMLVARLAQFSASEWRDLGDEQAAIESASAYLAAQRATSDDLERLHSLADGVAHVATPSQRYRADSRFHLAIAVVSQSERLTRSEVRIQSEMAGVRWLPHKDDALDAAEAARQHAAIVAAIEAEDEHKAVQLAREHAHADTRHIRRMHLQTITESRQTAQGER